ncbi:DNA-binding MarR family transcriptional regulator [Sphingomonas vulcanisoli]|uniref:DNA-binding MarR family transcriptional regulator n=1 Tax=Sphingomonas vulcanisoli TaxID=1658060 RepID=A0ABX0TPX3_9SPHN|nr:MarR family transcriptional regulator [Sphingomonas vulcanisoli]NIJ07588.1 DNA-binding MarR family transcriptional regulator [Sphingomonas vulcanisoli]
MDADKTEEGLGPLDSLLGYHLRRAGSVVGGAFSRAVSGTTLRQVPFAILSVIAANPGIKQGTAGQILGIQRANMVALINELVEAGYIDRQAAQDDRRAFALACTTKGQVALDHFTGEILRHEADLLADFSPADRKKLMQLLRRIEAREPSEAD